eukprot:CAMPEP_0182438276 /NCGR_PEP_ID=MMETSP1167-20130531/85644_1 /TAXON_ID=2988 /ORGANISM="Mallomonas Sp, Strain CCMP3275" /LENGTH=934 /DNA_ID=CAMNT_0024631551 /DNA_START=1 /DNA_END=2802 /DNA_ORIENTATION=-
MREDCDWLLWMVWRHCCILEPMDPESLITELEAYCSEVELTDKTESVSALDLWSLLGELKIRGDITRGQFDQGIKYMMYVSKYDSDAEKRSKSKDGKIPTTDTSLIDYQTFCRYIVRMGRAFNAKVQENRKDVEKRFQDLFRSLQDELLAMGRSIGDEVAGENAPYRFERIFKRMDADADGHLSFQEFKRGLRRIRCRDEKKWTLRMIRRLFHERESGRDGYLSLSDLSTLIKGKKADAKKEETKEEDSDSEDELFNRHKDGGSDAALMSKTTQALLDAIARSSAKDADHLETVKHSVKRFFIRGDPDAKGVVGEDRFRAFIRRSGLQDRLSTSEIRRLLGKFRRRVAIKGSGLRGTTMIDYERFLQQLSVASVSKSSPAPETSVPLSEAEAVVLKLQESCRLATVAGRPFLGLCTLVDPKSTGLISTTELILTCKMMGLVISEEEISKLKELLPNNAFKENGSLDYKELNWLINHYVHYRAPEKQFAQYRASHEAGALPGYAHPGFTTMFADGSVDLNRSILTPGGYFVMPPKKEEVKEEKKPEPVPYEKMVQDLTKKVKNAIDERNNAWGTSFSVKRHFQTNDPENCGWLSFETFQKALEHIGVSLSASEIVAIKHQFGRGGDDKICYEEFFHVILRQGGGWSHGAPLTAGATTRALSESLGLGASVQVTMHEALSEALALFHTHDRGRRGVIDNRLFREIVLATQLLTSEYQADKACEEYACISDRSLVYYGDFLSNFDIRPETPGPLRTSSTWDSPLRRSPIKHRGREFADLDRTYFNSHADRIDRRASEDSPRGRRENENVLASLHRFKQDVLDDSRRLSIDVDGFSDEYTGLGSARYPPIKPSDSINFNASRNFGKSIAEDTYMDDRVGSRGRSLPSNIFDTPVRHSHASRHVVAAPRSPPSKVAAFMWGSETPVDKRGNPPRVERGW